VKEILGRINNNYICPKIRASRKREQHRELKGRQ
jgi:hypothetical protein